MQNSPDTSFMPQQPLLRMEGSMRRKEPINFALILALIIFFVSLVVTGGAFFWHKQIVARVQAQAQKLEEAEKLLNTDAIASYKQIDTRIDNAKNLLQGHTIFSTILNLLEESTAQNIVLTSLGYSKDSTGLLLTLSGVGPSYEAVYSQGESWKAMKPHITKVDISGVSLAQDSGIVTFTAKININPELTKYAKLLEGENRIRKQQENAASVSAVPTVTPKAP